LFLPPSGQSVRNWHALGRVAARQLQLEQVVNGRLFGGSPIMKSLRMTAVRFVRR
jgi:hypothetical protein